MNADSATHVARLSVWLAMQRVKKREQRDSDEEERRIGQEDKEKLVLKEMQGLCVIRY